MTRPHDWPGRLLEALRAKADAPFAWGRNDCALFACDLAEAVCGVDFAAPFRGHYKSRAGAMRALRRFASPGAKRCGLEEVAEKIAAAHGKPEVPPLMAQRGDIVLIHTDSGPALGVCVGAQVAAAGPEGAIMLPLAAALRAWRV